MTDTRYEADFYQWTQAQAEALRAKDWPALDVDHLAEEIESLGASDRRALRSYLLRLSQHLLKWHYQPQRRGENWRQSIDDARLQIELIVEDSHSLRSFLPEAFAWAYPERGRPPRRTHTCPWPPSRRLAPGRWRRPWMRISGPRRPSNAGRGVRVYDPAAGEDMTTTLYDTDFDAWAQQQAEALRTKDWAALDIEHLAEEVEALRNSERKAVRSQLRRLMSHLLKWHYQPRRRSDSWQATIVDARRLLADDLEDNGTLVRELPALLDWAYPRARREAAKDTGIPVATFPEACPWTLAQLQDEDFFPRETA